LLFIIIFNGKFVNLIIAKEILARCSTPGISSRFCWQ